MPLTSHTLDLAICRKIQGKAEPGNSCLQTPGACESCPLWVEDRLRKSIEQAERRKRKVLTMKAPCYQHDSFDSGCSSCVEMNAPKSPKRSFLRKIMRIEKAANRLAYYEILSCGHRGRLAEGPNREYVPFGEMPKTRKCKECAECTF